MAITIDVNGLSCPEPIIRVNDAICKSKFPITVLADSEVVIENITRLVFKKGYEIVKAEGDEIVSLTINNKCK